MIRYDPQVLLQRLLAKSNSSEVPALQTGAGNTVSMQDPKTSKLVCKENMDEIGKAINILYGMREKIWQALQVPQDFSYFCFCFF